MGKWENVGQQAVHGRDMSGEWGVNGDLGLNGEWGMNGGDAFGQA